MRGQITHRAIGHRQGRVLPYRVGRQFKDDRPSRLQVSDFTLVSTWLGLPHMALAFVVFARSTAGWRVSSSMPTDFLLDALRQGRYACRPERDALIFHSGRGSEDVSSRDTKRLAEAAMTSRWVVTSTRWPRRSPGSTRQR